MRYRKYKRATRSLIQAIDIPMQEWDISCLDFDNIPEPSGFIESGALSIVNEWNRVGMMSTTGRDIRVYVYWIDSECV